MIYRVDIESGFNSNFIFQLHQLHLFYSMTSFTYFFSYWIFVWYILYILKLTPYNPKLALTIALFENIIKVGAMIYYSNNLNTILLFSGIDFIIKVLPLWTLRRTSYKHQIHTTMGLFIIYVLYLYINDQNVVSILKDTYRDVQHNKFEGPMSYLLKQFDQSRL